MEALYHPFSGVVLFLTGVILILFRGLPGPGMLAFMLTEAGVFKGHWLLIRIGGFGLMVVAVFIWLEVHPVLSLVVLVLDLVLILVSLVHPNREA